MSGCELPPPERGRLLVKPRPFKLFDEILVERAKGTAPKLHAVIEDEVE